MTSANFDAVAERRFWRRVALGTAAALTALLALERTSVDIALARLVYDSATATFPWRDHAATTRIAHDGLRFASAAVFAWIAVSVWKPLGLLRRLTQSQRVYLAVATVASFALISLLKRTSALHCPWGLAEFGGAHPYLRLFDPVPADWSRGACFPAGHALAAFAYFGGFFAWRATDARVARRWAGVVVLLGSLAGGSQQLRGAHFLSHALWTAWLAWAIAATLAWLVQDRLRRINPDGPAAG